MSTFTHNQIPSLGFHNHSAVHFTMVDPPAPKPSYSISIIAPIFIVSRKRKFSGGKESDTAPRPVTSSASPSDSDATMIERHDESDVLMLLEPRLKRPREDEPISFHDWLNAVLFRRGSSLSEHKCRMCSLVSLSIYELDTHVRTAHLHPAMISLRSHHRQNTLEELVLLHHYAALTAPGSRKPAGIEEQKEIAQFIFTQQTSTATSADSSAALSIDPPTYPNLLLRVKYVTQHELENGAVYRCMCSPMKAFRSRKALCDHVLAARIHSYGCQGSNQHGWYGRRGDRRWTDLDLLPENHKLRAHGVKA